MFAKLSLLLLVLLFPIQGRSALTAANRLIKVTSNFSIDINTLSLLDFDAASVVHDFGYGGQPDWTLNGTSIPSTTQFQFGPRSLEELGQNGVTSPNDTHTKPGAGDFTWECWVWESNWTAHQNGLGSNDNGAAGGYNIYHNSSNLWGWQHDGTNMLTFTKVMTNSTWQHVVFMRSGTLMYGFIDGVLQNTALDTTSYTGGGANAFWGYDVSNNFPFYGYIDECRLSNVARYSITGFTPPTAPFPH